MCNNVFIEHNFRHLCTSLPGFWKNASLASRKNKRTVLKISSPGQSYCHHTAGLDSSKIRQATPPSFLHGEFGVPDVSENDNKTCWSLGSLKCFAF